MLFEFVLIACISDKDKQICVWIRSDRVPCTRGTVAAVMSIGAHIAPIAGMIAVPHRVTQYTMMEHMTL